jgi:hypothetical protein
MEIGVEYKRSIVRAFEQESGKWRARIWRVDGAPIALAGRRKLRCFVTGIDANTAPSAMLMAMDAIDAVRSRPIDCIGRDIGAASTEHRRPAQTGNPATGDSQPPHVFSQCPVRCDG